MLELNMLFLRLMSQSSHIKIFPVFSTNRALDNRAKGDKFFCGETSILKKYPEGPGDKVLSQ